MESHSVWPNNAAYCLSKSIMLTDPNSFGCQRNYWGKKEIFSFPKCFTVEFINNTDFLIWTQCWIKEENELWKLWFCSFFKLFWGVSELSLFCSLSFVCSFVQYFASRAQESLTHFSSFTMQVSRKTQRRCWVSFHRTCNLCHHTLKDDAC